VDEIAGGAFDIVTCLRWLQNARYPMMLFRTLSRLMKEGGTLVLQSDYLDCYPGVPLMYSPLGSEAPTNPRGCSYFNKEGLLNALATFGFHDFVIHSEMEQGIDAARDFARMPFATSGVAHDSESAIGVITLSCTWQPSAADQDPRYSIDGVTGQMLVDTWDRHLPASGIPEHQATEQMLAHLRDQVYQHAEQARKLKEALRTATAAVHDRDKDLQDTRRDLAERTDDLVATRQIVVERTDDLVATRQLLIERTAMLEQMVAQAEALSRALAEANAR